MQLQKMTFQKREIRKLKRVMFCFEFKKIKIIFPDN